MNENNAYKAIALAKTFKSVEMYSRALTCYELAVNFLQKITINEQSNDLEKTTHNLIKMCEFCIEDLQQIMQNQKENTKLNKIVLIKQ
ncbi:unknown [Euproctis pseudoconspersa nucleopolyhedrovirus]|uniref:Uncharacterized protein n=1 Tax=Euproctis pseudoconspersa nucleopolyhedrovirus TaxID=307467 RepID=C3TX22_9ABAC|nr:hypothetical protein EupsNPV_gp114 [Euproctis pseudoconspersa nucleopolyhedrovirus]ACO53564.1 unknown [Euproctis pseudoconspersa nucleopolyhedrovirus]QUJ09304.1 hypothetical protein Gyru_ORF109 [Gynaephora ruoergensis nucleopolyhedrovirus]